MPDGVGAVVVDRRPVGAPRIRVLRHRRVVVAADQVVQAQRHRVVDVGLVRVQQQRAHRLHDDRVVTPRHPNPVLGDVGRAGIRVPRQPAEGIPVGLRQVMARPVAVAAGVGDAGNPGAALAGERSVHDLRYRRAGAFGEGVGVEELAPQRRQVHQVRRVPEVLLRDLQLGHHRRLQRAKQRVERLAGLEVERPVLHLHEDVVAELCRRAARTPGRRA